ncbi:MAG: glycosyltransferase family 2 protein [Marinirhabdus sp.]
MRPPKITALAITLNEAANLPRFLQQLWFADEVVVVDSGSTDGTVQLAKAAEKVTLVHRSFDDFSTQKKFAIAQASHDWIVFFDPDEEIPQPLAHEIVAAVANPGKQVAFMVKRVMHFIDKPIRYGGAQSDWIIRIFNKNHCRYNQNMVHETIIAHGPVGRLRTKVPHYGCQDFDAYTTKLHKYAALQAQQLYAKKMKPNPYHFFIKPLYRFINEYFFRLGFLDGKEGYMLAYLNAFTVFKRYLNLWMLHRKID